MPTIGDMAAQYGSRASNRPASRPGPAPKRRQVSRPQAVTRSALRIANGSRPARRAGRKFSTWVTRRSTRSWLANWRARS